MLKGNFKRHVMSHLLQWRCLNCAHTYSRDDTANKHATGKSCGSMECNIVVEPIVHLDSDSESE